MFTLVIVMALFGFGLLVLALCRAAGDTSREEERRDGLALLSRPARTGEGIRPGRPAPALHAVLPPADEDRMEPPAGEAASILSRDCYTEERRARLKAMQRRGVARRPHLVNLGPRRSA